MQILERLCIHHHREGMFATLSASAIFTEVNTHVLTLPRKATMAHALSAPAAARTLIIRNVAVPSIFIEAFTIQATCAIGSIPFQKKVIRAGIASNLVGCAHKSWPSTIIDLLICISITSLAAPCGIIRSLLATSFFKLGHAALYASVALITLLPTSLPQGPEGHSTGAPIIVFAGLVIITIIMPPALLADPRGNMRSSLTTSLFKLGHAVLDTSATVTVCLSTSLSQGPDHFAARASVIIFGIALTVPITLLADHPWGNMRSLLTACLLKLGDAIVHTSGTFIAFFCHKSSSMPGMLSHKSADRS